MLSILSYNLFLVSLVVLVYFLATLGLYIFQRSLLYHPTENNYGGDRLTVNIEKVKIELQRRRRRLEVFIFLFSFNVISEPLFIFSYGWAQDAENWFKDKPHVPEPYLQLSLVSPF